MKKQIVALGGGGFSTESNELADRFILGCAGVTQPRICFLATASGDTESYIGRFYTAFQKLDCAPSHVALFKNNIADIEAHLRSQHVIYVGGGNTKSMLAVWREWGVDQVLRQAYEQGIVLAGTSAGAICWFEQGLTDSFYGEYRPLNGLGLLAGSACPHFSNTEIRPRVFADCVQRGEIASGYGMDDGSILHFADGELHSALASHANAKVYFHERGKSETVLSPKPLANLVY